jgi:CheY-like chemotaxis protein
MSQEADRASIIVTDDDQDVRSVVADTLAEAGYAVHAAGNGHEALKVLRSREGIRLLLTDIVMPDMEGLELIKQTRRQHPGLKIIAMSGAGADKFNTYLMMAKSLGADAVLAKPFTKDELLFKVSALIGR